MNDESCKFVGCRWRCNEICVSKVSLQQLPHPVSRTRQTEECGWPSISFRLILPLSSTNGLYGGPTIRVGNTCMGTAQRSIWSYFSFNVIVDEMFATKLFVDSQQLIACIKYNRTSKTFHFNQLLVYLLYSVVR